MTDPRTRFDGCARAYALGRPGYPAALAAVLAPLGVRPGAVVADVGAGAGQFTRWLLDAGAVVHAVEPSAAMRAEAAAALGERAGLHLVDGAAEATTLPAASVDVVTAAQAFHWFETAPTRAEWRRILRPGGRVILVWNTRRLDDPFGAELDATLRAFGDRYDAIGHTGPRRQALIDAFFDVEPAAHVTVDNPFVLDAAGWAAYVGSISYLPSPGHPRHADARAALDALFARHAVGGRVTLPMVTDVHHGRLG